MKCVLDLLQNNARGEGRRRRQRGSEVGHELMLVKAGLLHLCGAHCAAPCPSYLFEVYTIKS